MDTAKMAVKCAALAGTARDLAAGMDRIATGLEGCQRLPLHEREVGYAMEAVVHGLDIVKSLMHCLEDDLNRARKMHEMVQAAQNRCQHYSKSCLHMQRNQHQGRKG